MNIWRKAVEETRKKCKEVADSNSKLLNLTAFNDLIDEINDAEHRRLDLSRYEGPKKAEIQSAYETLLRSEAGHQTLSFSSRKFRDNKGGAMKPAEALLFLLLANALYGIECKVSVDDNIVPDGGTLAFKITPIVLPAIIETTPRQKREERFPVKQDVPDPKPGKIYILHYVRANHTRKDGDYNRPGFGTLQLLDEEASGKKKKKELIRRKAILKINYPSGRVEEMFGTYVESGKTNLFVRVRDFVDGRAIEGHLSFAFNAKSPQLLIGTYSSVRRGAVSGDSIGTPICGMLVGDLWEESWAPPRDAIESLLDTLEKSGGSMSAPEGEYAEQLKDYLERIYAIRYFLADKRFSGIPGGSNNLAGKGIGQLPIDSYHLWKKNVEKYSKGTYEGFYLKTTSRDNPTFERFIFTINADGRAQMKTINRNVGDVGIYHGYIRVVSQSGGILAYFDYQASFDFYRFEMFLHAHTGKHSGSSYSSKEDQLYLYGSFAGFEKYDENRPISGRIILRRTNETGSMPNSVPMPNNSTTKKALLDLFQEDQLIHSFLKGEGSTFKSITDGMFWGEYFKEGAAKSDYSGNEHVFTEFNEAGYVMFTYYSVVQNTREHHFVEKGFLGIGIDGTVTYRKGKSETYSGKLSLIENSFHGSLRRQGNVSGEIHLIISGFPGASIERIGDSGVETGYGICLIYSEGAIEARYFALSVNIKKDAEPSLIKVNKLMTYGSESSALEDRNETLQLLNEWDKDHGGAVTYIMGSANRYLKSTRRINDQFEPRTHHERRSNFYAAFGIANLHKFEQDIEKQKQLLEEFRIYLRKAFLHGFASEWFSGGTVETVKQALENKQEYDIAAMLNDILKEQQELKVHIGPNGALSASVYKDEVIALWPGLIAPVK